MSLSVAIGLIFALTTAVTAVVGNLMKHRGAESAPPVELARPVRTSLALFRSRWYTLGMLVAITSWGFHVAALALAPISLAQAVIAAGLVFLAVVADRIFHLHVTRREWIGVGLAACGLAFLAATLDGTAESAHNSSSALTLGAYTGVACALGIGAALATRSIRHGGPLLGVSAGLLWGASDVAIKALTRHFDEGFAATVLDPFILVVICASLVGLTVSARSLQLGPPVTVIALTATAGNVTTILSGPVVFNEPFPDDAVGAAMRVAALVLVVVAAVLTPPRAEAEGHMGPL